MRIASCVQSKRGATGAAARWHPYPSSIQLSHATSTKRIQPSFTSISTPTTTPATSSATVEFTFQVRPLSTHASANDEGYFEAKRAQKEKFENTLKELAVKRLAEIWKDTAYVINSAHRSQSFVQDASPMVEKPIRYNVQNLLSPETPSLSPNPFAFQAPSSHSDARHMPLRAFVYDIIRRSRTGWPALQVALCYLDAVREKVPTVIHEVNNAEGLKAAEAALDSLFGARSAEEEIPRPASSDTKPLMVTQTVTPPVSEHEGSQQICPMTTSTQIGMSAPALIGSTDSQAPARRFRRRRVPQPPPAPLPPRPSPLLCPRRMFVAALILACKFTQDRVYSNRAWARISGLEPREISRCERALGQALEWRLWVGKGMDDEPTAFLRNFLIAEEIQAQSAVRPVGNGIARSMSDSALLTPNSWAGSPFVVGSPECVSPHFSSALKRTSSLNAADFLGTCQPVTPILNGGNSLPLTSTLDLDTTRSNQPDHCVAFAASSPTLSVSSLTSCEYSFIPTTGSPSPPSSQSCRTPESLSHQDDDFGMIILTPLVNATPGFDPVLATPAPFGIDGTHDLGIIDSTDFGGTPSV